MLNWSKILINEFWCPYCDYQVKGPKGEQVQDFRDKTSDKFDFVAHNEGLYQFCFTNKSPYHETVDFDVHSSHFYHDIEHAKDGETFHSCSCTISILGCHVLVRIT